MKMFKSMILTVLSLSTTASLFSMNMPRLDTYLAWVNSADTAKGELGQIAINSNGGVAPYNYVYYKNVPANFTKFSIINDLEPGIYTIFVVDGAGRVQIHQAEVNDKAAEVPPAAK